MNNLIGITLFARKAIKIKPREEAPDMLRLAPREALLSPECPSLVIKNYPPSLQVKKQRRQ